MSALLAEPVQAITAWRLMLRHAKDARLSAQEAYMRGYVDRCGHMARMFSIGKSKLNREMWALEISNNPGATDTKPNARYIGNMHGDEPASRCCTHLGHHFIAQVTSVSCVCLTVAYDSIISQHSFMN